MNLSVEYSIDLSSVDRAIREQERELTERMRGVRDDALEAIEQEQILAYTATTNPPALDYERTFTLQSASRTEVTSDRLPEISGEWRVDESVADYGEYVLGTRQQQAEIHRDRWKSAEQVIEAVDRKIPEFVEQRFR